MKSTRNPSMQLISQFVCTRRLMCIQGLLCRVFCADPVTAVSYAVRFPCSHTEGSLPLWSRQQPFNTHEQRSTLQTLVSRPTPLYQMQVWSYKLIRLYDCAVLPLDRVFMAVSRNSLRISFTSSLSESGWKECSQESSLKLVEIG